MPLFMDPFRRPPQRTPHQPAAVLPPQHKTPALTAPPPVLVIEPTSALPPPVQTPAFHQAPARVLVTIQLMCHQPGSRKSVMPLPTSQVPAHPHPTLIPVPVTAAVTIPTPAVRDHPIPTLSPQGPVRREAPAVRALPVRAAVLRDLIPVQVTLLLVLVLTLDRAPIQAVIQAQRIQVPPTIAAAAMTRLQRAVISADYFTKSNYKNLSNLNV